ncbi:MAG: magnesium/cobalt transporter CorA [Vicingaceae bacterium]
MKTNKNKIGLPPGTLLSNDKKNNSVVTIIDYNADELEEKTIENLNELEHYKTNNKYTWINVNGIYDIETLETVGKIFCIPEIFLEDIQNIHHRPKAEQLPDQLFLILKMIETKANHTIDYEQVTMVLGVDYLITFQEKEGDVFNLIRERLRSKTGKLRKMGADFLFYRIIDIIVDHYYLVIEDFGTKIMKLENDVIEKPDRKQINTIQQLKKSIIKFKKNTLPLREAILIIQKDSEEIITESYEKYFTDIYDHIIFLIDAIETQRDIISGVTDLYLSNISNQTNEIMKTLTVIATIFIPLTFIAGVYGMNFKYMPELEWTYGYYAIWGVMIVVALLLVWYFKKKNIL